MVVDKRSKVSSDQIPLVELAPKEVGEIDLYQKRERIYTRAVEGFYQRLRLFTGWPLLLGYFLLPWVQWPIRAATASELTTYRQAVLFDLPARQFHLLNISLWPQDLPLLAGVLIMAAFALFTVTVFAGRVWCGYTCPQTVWTSIFMWAEQVTEGTRNQRIRLDAAPWSIEKGLKKLTKHGMWLGFSALTGLTFVGYFTPIRELVVDLPLAQAGFHAYAWVIFFTLATYINAGWMREQLCMYVCPYARFQAVMFDRDTLIVSYDAQRGEPRGSRKIGIEPKTQGLGDCVDCQLCVQVCPTGIDIRDGLQYQCITCALCIDACDSVMEKLHYPKGLIRYTTQNLLEQGKGRILRPRLIGYLLVTLLIASVFGTALLTRVPLEVDVIRERGTLYHLVGQSEVENIYQLRIMNKSQQSQSLTVRVEDLPGARIVGDTEITVLAGEVFNLPIRVRIDRAQLLQDNSRFRFVVESTDAAEYAGYRDSYQNSHKDSHTDSRHQRQDRSYLRAESESRFLFTRDN